MQQLSEEQLERGDHILNQVHDFLDDCLTSVRKKTCFHVILLIIKNRIINNQEIYVEEFKSILQTVLAHKSSGVDSL